jgi:GLPGLI family protein
MPLSSSFTRTIIVITLLLATLKYTVLAQTANSSIFGHVEYKCFPDSAAFERRLTKLKAENAQGVAPYGDEIRAANQAAKLLSFDLFFNDSVAYSVGRDEAIVESTVKLHMAVAKAMLNAESVYSMNVATQTKLYETSLGDGSAILHVIEPFDKYDWSLTSETKTIGGYECRKAVGKHSKNTVCCGEKTDTVIAWFAPQIPFPFGPLGYDGLPGLILEVSTGTDAMYTFRATSISLERGSEKSIPGLQTPVKTYTQEEFDDFMTDRIERIRRN